MNSNFVRFACVFVFLFLSSVTAIAQECPVCDDPANCSKFVFEFVPEKVRLAPRETLPVTIQKWRTAKWLTEETRTQPNRCPEDRNISAPLDKIHIPTANWYVIIQDGRPNAGEQYLPPQKLGPNSQPIDTGNIPGYRWTLPVSNVTVRPTGDTEEGKGEIYLSDLPEGDYWFTLQNLANINDGGRCELECNKTTPPVKIEIRKPRINMPPTITVTASKNCEPIPITVTVGDEDNLPNSGVPRQTLTLTGKFRHRETNSERPMTFNPGTTMQASYTETVELTALDFGSYEVEVWVSDGTDRRVGNTSFTVENCPDYDKVLRGAAVLYFQYDEPRKNEWTNASLESSDPRKWSAYEKRVKCADQYPGEEIEDFRGSEFPKGTNTERIRMIAEDLRRDKAKYLVIKAFTDAKACNKYNCNLGMRRAKAVKDYLDRNYPDLSERVQITSVNFGESLAKPPYPKKPGEINCSDEQKWDRRVELYYSTRPLAGVPPGLSQCENETCDTSREPPTKRRKKSKKSR